MTKKEKNFIEILQVAMGCRPQLSTVPTKEEWTALLDIAVKQSLVGVSFAGVEATNQNLPKEVLWQWFALSEQIKLQNQKVNENTIALCKSLEEDGFECCILKGQGNALMYPNPYSRTPGDIDLWALPKLKSENFEYRDCLKRTILYVKERNPKGKV